MRLLPSVLNWSYHRQFAGRWLESFDEYLNNVDALRKKYGFNEMGINVSVGDMCSILPGHDQKSLSEVKKKLEYKGFEPIAILGPLEVHSDKQVVRDALERIKKPIEYAQAIGAHVSQFYFPIWGRLTKEKAVRIYIDILSDLGKYAGEFGQTVCSENYCTFTGNEIITAVENCGSPHVGYLNDIGNWLITGEDPVAATRKMADKTVHVHLKDYVLEDGIWKSVPFGKGIIDIYGALNVLAETKVDRTVHMAFEMDMDDGDEDAALDECFAYMQKWYATIAR